MKIKLKKIKLSFPSRLTIGLIFLAICVALIIAFTTVPVLANFALPKLAFLTSKISQYTPRPTPTPTIKEIKPSEKALKIASFAVVRLPDKEKKEFKTRYGSDSMSDTELIRVWALKMDNDLALMAQNEAATQKYIEEHPQQQGYSYYTDPVVIQEPARIQETPNPIQINNKSDDRLQKIERCQEETQRYNDCIQEYNEKMSDYSQCLAEASDLNSQRAKGYGRYASMSCYKPFNSCMKSFSCN